MQNTSISAQAAIMEHRQHPADVVEALRFLVEYNLYDSFQLRSLMDRGYNLAVQKLALDEPRLTVFDRGDVLYDVSRLLLDLCPSAQDLEVLARVRREEFIG